MSGPAPAGLVLDPCELEGAWCVRMPIHRDERGQLSRCYDGAVFHRAGPAPSWVQQVISVTDRHHTLRGLHAQRAPYTEAKLVVPVCGAMFWVIVDVRAGSPSFGAWQGFRLDPALGYALYAARGFAHGCLSLSDGVILSILSDNVHVPGHGAGIRWDDPELAIDWPLEGRQPLVSDAHAASPDFRTFREGIGGL